MDIIGKRRANASGLGNAKMRLIWGDVSVEEEIEVSSLLIALAGDASECNVFSNVLNIAT